MEALPDVDSRCAAKASPIHRCHAAVPLENFLFWAWFGIWLSLLWDFRFGWEALTISRLFVSFLSLFLWFLFLFLFILLTYLFKYFYSYFYSYWYVFICWYFFIFVLQPCLGSAFGVLCIPWSRRVPGTGLGKASKEERKRTQKRTL